MDNVRITQLKKGMVIIVRHIPTGNTHTYMVVKMPNARAHYLINLFSGTIMAGVHVTTLEEIMHYFTEILKTEIIEIAHSIDDLL